MNAIAARLTVLLLAALLLLPAAARADLPDFTVLVEKYAPAVVNITARKSNIVAEDPSALDPEEAPDLFRYFFGPNGPNGPHGRGQMPERISGGSGFIVSADGYILTNHHVVEGADEVMVRLKDRRELRAKVIGSDEQSDVALLKVEATGLPAVMLGDSNKLKPGQWVVAIGSPLNFDYSVTAGVVSAVGRAFSGEQRYVPFIQTDVAINRGNSGGPLFNLAGEVVGINSQIISASGGYMGLSFAIPIEVANGVVQQLKTKGKVSRGSLGVLIQRVGAAEAQALDLPRIGGALVSEIQADSAAAKAGLKVQDVILSYNEMEIGDSAELPPMVGATAPGTRATLEVFRDGKTLSLPVTVAELPTEPGRATAATAAVTGNSGLGLSVRDLTADEREQLELGAEGVLVERVVGGEARRAGIQPGDIVLRVGRTPVNTAKAFETAAKAARAGEPVLLLVRRGEATTFLTIRPEAAGSDE